MLKFEFVEGANTKPFETYVQTEMDKHIKHFQGELVKIRTGRAHTSMLEDLKVQAYGGIMSLRDVASLSAPDVSLLIVQPWDQALIPDIEKAISSSELGLTPQNDGAIIRIQIPRMSGSRRDELTKMLGKKLEECRIGIRNVRKDFHNLIRDAEKSKKLSEDSSRRLQDLLQKITDKLVDLAEVTAKKKEDELKQL